MGDDTDERLAVDLYIAALLKEERVESTIAAKVMIELLKKLDRLKAENEKLRAMLDRIKERSTRLHQVRGNLKAQYLKTWMDEFFTVLEEIEAELKGGK